jgi:polyvinyl alcohol dehydrogenase (cytochrome)
MGFGSGAAAVAGLCLVLAAAAAEPPERSPAELYERACASCHDAPPDARTPDRTALERLGPMEILAALEVGVMRTQASGLAPREKRALALHLGARRESPALPASSRCSASGDWDPGTGPRWLGFGGSAASTRFQQDAQTTSDIAPARVGRLALAWTFAYPGASVANGALVSAGGRLFMGSQDGTVYALSAGTGCIHWSFRADAWVRTAPALEVRADERAGHAAYFGDSLAQVYAVDASDGRVLWKRSVDDDAVITGSPQVHEQRVFVPLSAGIEVPRAADPGYECCRLRGSVVALAAETGEILWKTHTTGEPRATRTNARGTQMYGPSGAPVWSSVVLDPKRGALYVGTGENYSPPATQTSDALLALDQRSGALLWVRQFTEGDVWQSSCSRPGGLEGNCPFTPGPDLDVGATPLLHTLPGGKQLLVVGEKSGRVHALDPDRRGEVVWSTRVGRGGMQGGIHWGIAADGDSVYATVSDHVEILRRVPGRIETRDDPEAGALVALDAATGRIRWRAQAPKGVCAGREGCYAALSAAPAVSAGGVVLAGSLDGHLRAYSARDGSVLWDYDTARDFGATNGVAAHGGAIDGSGPILVGGRVFVNSGYGRFGQMPGNSLLAFGVAPDPPGSP